jgi:hypothetical protein
MELVSSVTIVVGNCQHSYFNPSKELPVRIRIYDRIVRECGISTKLSFIVCWEVGVIASAFCRSVAGERVKDVFVFQMSLQVT